MASTIRSPERGLTPKFIEALKPDPDRRYEVADRRASGLRLRVYPSSVKSFRWVCNSRGQVYTLGSWALVETPGFVTLAQAREWLDKLKAGNAGGTIDAVEAELKTFLRRRARVADAVQPTVTLFKDVVEQFYQRRIVPHRKRPDYARRMLDRDILPLLGDRPIETLTTRECAAAIEYAVDRGVVVHAGKVLTLLKQALRFAEARGFRVGNPAGPLDPKDLGVQKKLSPDRWLTADEIVLLWRALDAPPSPVAIERPDPRTGKVQEYEQRVGVIAPATAAALKILLLTGARTGELLRAKWADVDLDAATWTIPVANQKLTKARERDAKPFVIPLSVSAVGLFRDLKALADEVAGENAEAERAARAWVVPSAQSHDGKYSGGALGKAMRRLFTGRSPRVVLPGGEASPHDLRRTMRTHLGKLRIPLHITERCLNHALGRIVEIYDQGDYLDERREALDKWDAYVQRLLAPEQSNVAFLPAAVGGAA